MNELSELTRFVSPEELDEFLCELNEIGGAPNTVRVVKYTHSRPNRRMRAVVKKVLDEVFPSKVGIAAITKLDELRVLAGQEPRYLREFFRLGGGELVDVAANIRTNAGIDYVAGALGDSSGGRPAVAYYMALSENATAPTATDTTLTAEITTGGLARVTSSYTHTTGVASYALSKTFTATAPFSAVQKDGIFNAGAAGTLFVSAQFTSTALATSDQLTIQHTVNI